MRVNCLVTHDKYSNDTTLGKYYIAKVDDECSWNIDNKANYFSETLEDAVRPAGIKIYGKTAIPQDIELKMTVRMSPNFGREMVMLYNQPNGYEIIHEGMSWTYILNHGGNTDKDTLGCILTAKNRSLSDMRIYGTMEAEFTAKIKGYIEEGYACYWKSINLPYSDKV